MAKILLVSKDVSLGNILADTMRSRSTNVVDIVHSTEEAVALFKREMFQLVVLDISREKDAAQAVSLVRKSAAAVAEKRIPLIVVAKSFSESSFLLDSGEVDVLLEYPAHADQLGQVVEQFGGC